MSINRVIESVNDEQQLLKVLKTLIEDGSDVNAPNEDGKTPLHFAAYGTSSEAMKLLIEHGSIIDSRDKQGCTPLIYACDNGDEEMIKLLLDNGADIEARSNNGNNS